MPELASHLAHIVETDPGGCVVAEIGGLVVGYAQAIVRGDIWFLAQLFVQPEVHALGVGQELLRRSMQYGRDRSVRIFSVVSSTSPAAQALYMRSGMYAIGIGYRVTGPVFASRCSDCRSRMATARRSSTVAARRIGSRSLTRMSSAPNAARITRCI